MTKDKEELIAKAEQAKNEGKIIRCGGKNVPYKGRNLANLIKNVMARKQNG